MTTSHETETGRRPDPSPHDFCPLGQNFARALLPTLALRDCIPANAPGCQGGMSRCRRDTGRPSMTSISRHLGALSAGVAASVLVAGAALADPAVIFDLGGKFDKSFNEMPPIRALKPGRRRPAAPIWNSNCRTTPSASRPCAASPSGANPIVMPGFSQATALAASSPPNSPTPTSSSSMPWSTLPNVQSIVFEEHRLLPRRCHRCAAKSETGKVGFVGGMDVPLIHKFACGYAQGAKAVNPDARDHRELHRHHPGGLERSRSPAVNSPSPSSIAGADVSFAAAGGSGLGVLQAAADAGKLGIGVDSQPELPASRLGADLDAEARRRRRPTPPSRKPATATWTPGLTVSALPKAASAMRSTTTTRR
jgi:basic membrane protein A